MSSASSSYDSELRPSRIDPLEPAIWHLKRLHGVYYSRAASSLSAETLRLSHYLTVDPQLHGELLASAASSRAGGRRGYCDGLSLEEARQLKRRRGIPRHGSRGR